MRLRVVGDGPESDVAVWEGGFTPPGPDADQLRTLTWGRQALADACQRAGTVEAVAAWTAAVEGSWWTAALSALTGHLDRRTGV